MTTPQLLVSVNGGAPTAGPIVCNPGDVIQPSVASTIGIQTYRYAFSTSPDGWSTPAGWSLDSGSGEVFWTAGTPTPPAITMPASTPYGAWMLYVQADGDATRRDDSMLIEIVSPSIGLHDFPYGELHQRSLLKAWTRAQQQNVRLLDAALKTAGGFATAYDHDFTADLTAVLTDGAATIGGLAGKVVNQAAHSSLFSVTNGTGLQIWASNACDYDNVTRTAPLIWIPLSSFAIPGLHWGTRLRMMMWFEDSVDADSYPHTAQYEASFIGLDNNAVNFHRVVMRGVVTGEVQGIGYKAHNSAGDLPLTYDMTATSPSGNLWGGAHWAATGTNNVLVMETIDGLASGGARAMFGTYSAGWPSMGILNPALDHHEKDSYPTGASINVGTLAAANAGPGALIGVVVGAANSGGASPYKFALKRLRLDYRN